MNFFFAICLQSDILVPKLPKASQTSIIENNVEYNPNDPIPIELAIRICAMKKQPCLKKLPNAMKIAL